MPQQHVKPSSSHVVSESDMADFMLELARAVQEAGGKVVTLEDLKTMTAYEFIRLVAPNKIRLYAKEEIIYE